MPDAPSEDEFLDEYNGAVVELKESGDLVNVDGVADIEYDVECLPFASFLSFYLTHSAYLSCVSLQIMPTGRHRDCWYL